MKQKGQHSQMLMLPTNVNPVYISELSETNDIFELKTCVFIFTNSVEIFTINFHMHSLTFEYNCKNCENHKQKGNSDIL